ncbi:hypothetical protein KAR28_04305 [Candidatus Parcubacteria bacterium]|nr:hypothetical protein [Candidatus Parcubacteria bacterium]
MKVDKLASAIRKQGEYDGFIVPNADPKVGTTYGITNNDLLNQALGVAKRTSIPQSILSKREIALKDDVIDSVWQSKYSEKYGKMASKAVELTKKVDMAKIGEKKTLERQLNKLTDKLADTEAGFLKEYYAEIHKKEKPIKEKEEKPVIKEKIILIKKGKIGQSQAEILAGLEKVKAGKREAVRDDNGFIKKWTGERSTFPKWIPSNLRQAKIVKPVIKHIYGKTEPKKADEIRLYNVVAKKIQETSYLEKVQKEITEKITKKAPVVKEKIKGKERIEKIKLTAKEKRQNILDKIKMQNDTVQAIKQEIVNYAKQYLDLKEKGKLLATVKNAKTFKDLDKAKIYIEKLSEEAGQRIIIKKIQKAIKETVAKGKIPKGKYTPEIQNVLNSIKKLTDLNQKNANLKIENNLREYAEKMPVEIALENKLLSLYTGTAKEKQELLNIINQLKEKGEVASALKSFNIQSDIQMKSSLVIERVTGGKGIEQGRLRGEPADKTKIEKVKQYLKAIGKKTILDWRGLMTASDFNASVKVKPLADFFSLVKNESKYKELQNKYIEKFNEAVSDIYKIKNKPNSILKIVNKIATDKIKVDKYEMTRDELIKRYMEIQDPTLIESFLRGNRYTDKTLEAIKNKITEQDKKFAEWQLDYYGKIYNQINAVYSNMTGVNLPFNKFYSPIKRIGHDTKPGHSELLDEAFYRKAVTNKSLISRIKNLSPIAKQGSMEVLDRHIANVNYYTAWAEKIRELDSVFTNNEVREAYKQEFPASLLSSIDNKIQHIATHGNKMASRIGWVDYVRKNYVIGNLAVKPALTVKQLVSTLAYAEKLSAKDLTIGILDFLKRPIKNYNILKNESAFIKTRGAGMERDIQDALREGVFSRYNKKQNLANAMLLNVKLGDKGAIVLGSWAMRKQRLKSGVKLKDVITEYEEFGSDTQQSADISRLSEIQLGGSIEKLFTIFKSSQRAYFQKEVNAIKSMFRKDGFGKENLKKVAKTLWIYHILLPVFFQWVANMGGWDKDDKKDYLRAGILGSLNGLFIAGDVIDGTIRQVMKMNVWDIEIIIADIGDDINKIISNLTEDDVDVKDIQTALDAFASASTGVSGLPVEYSYDILESLYNENYETGIKQILGWSEYVIGAPKKEKTKTPVIRTRKKRTPRKRRRR